MGAVVEGELEVKLPTGLHMRPADKLSKFCRARGSEGVTITFRRADTQNWHQGDSILDLMMLAVKPGDTLVYRIEGVCQESCNALIPMLEEHVTND